MVYRRLCSLGFLRRWWITISLFLMLTTSFYLYLYSQVHTSYPTKTVIYQDKNVTSAISQHDHITKCRLPVLDPWHSSVKGLVKDPGKLDCGTSVSTFENNTLYVDVNDAVSVSYRIISRPEGNDFSRSLSEPFSISRQISKPSHVTSGASGCLMHIESKKCLHPAGGKSQPEEGTLLVFHSDCCFKRIEFKMAEDKSIVHVPSGLCIQAKDDKVILHKDCSTKFTVVNGTLHVTGKELCIESTDDRLPKNDKNVMVGSSCSQAFGLVKTQEGKEVKTSAYVNADFIRVDIKQGDGKPDITQVHMQAAPKPDALKRTRKPTGIPVNIGLIMFDSTSAANFIRHMTKSNEYLKTRPTIYMKGNTVVGDGTTAQLCAMLTGIAEEDEPEARRSKPNSKVVDDWRWVFRDYRNHGYVTMYSEDSPNVNTFNYRLKGFKNPPTDHYGRYFWIEGENHRHDSYCSAVNSLNTK